MFLRIAFIVVFGFSARAQDAFTVKYFGTTIHPFGDPSAALQPYKLDDEARFVLNFGGFAGYERFVYRDLISVKGIFGVFTDCSAGLGSATHLGIRINMLHTEKHRVYFGIGPTLIVRDSWTRFGEKYTPSGYFNVTDTKRFGELQWKFIPYGLEFEYDYAFTEHNLLSISCTPGVPLAIIVSVGWKHWIRPIPHREFRPFIPRKKR